MPLYEYKCTACHKRTEKIQKFSDPEITACPKCGSVLERVISAPAISFKGGGWFADGYGNAKPAASSNGSSEGGSNGGESKEGSGSKENSGSESKTSGDSSGASSTPAAAPTSAPAAPTSSSPAAASSSNKS